LEHWELQQTVQDFPKRGKLIPGGHGLRKLRWMVKGKGKGKRGGARIIYYFDEEREILLFLLIYEKNEKEDIAAADLKALANLIRTEFKQ
jgi:mRNA-degrading endonuclease RelE of RelBE toxin-antitoxin system